MSCNHCAVKYSFFNKELGCSNCGISLCSKCLQQKCPIPSKGQGQFKVCRACYPALTSSHSTTNVPTILPPDRFLKRLESLANPSAPPITVYRQDPKLIALKSGLSTADQELVERLEKLKDKPKLIPTDSEIRERLSKLKKDTVNVKDTNQKFFIPSDTRTEQEKINSLLEQYASEKNIDTALTSQDDLRQRVAILKGEQLKENKMDYEEDDADSENEVDEITKKIISEISLEERCPIGASSRDDEKKSSSPELPWCVLCNNDAKYRCFDCGGDLYCTSCNVEVHKNWGDTDHKVVSYKQNSS